MNSPKLTRRTANAKIASGNSISAVAIGPCTTEASPAAITPPSTVPAPRSSARCQVSAKNGCSVRISVMVSQCA